MLRLPHGRACILGAAALALGFAPMAAGESSFSCLSIMRAMSPDRPLISGGDGFSTMGDGTQTYMFSFGPLSGLEKIASGQPGTDSPSEFNLDYTAYAAAHGLNPRVGWLGRPMRSPTPELCS